MPIRSNNAAPTLLALAIALFVLSTLLAATPHNLFMQLVGVSLYGALIVFFLH